MIAVIFEVWPKPDQRQRYLDIAAELRPLLEKIDGFLSIERFESLHEPGSSCRCRSGATRRPSRSGGGSKLTAPRRPPGERRCSATTGSGSRGSFAIMG